MNTKPLGSMSDHVREVLDYTHESHEYKRGIALIKWYSDLLSTPLCLDMFRGEKPLFPNFTITDHQSESTNRGLKQAVFSYGQDEFAVTIYCENKYKKGTMCYHSKYHLKTVEDLCDMNVLYSLDSEYSSTELFEVVC
jgi:hypothetical protein